MKKHIADKNQIEGYRSSIRLFGSHGAKTSNKSIEMITEATTKRVWYEVYAHNGCIMSGPDLDEAIEIYNKF